MNSVSKNQSRNIQIAYQGSERKNFKKGLEPFKVQVQMGPRAPPIILGIKMDVGT